MRIHRQLLAGLVTVSITAASLATGPGSATPAERRLAVKLARIGRTLVKPEVPTVTAIKAAVAVAREAAHLDPADPGRWRMVRDLALLAENDEVYAAAVREIARLDPADDVARLARITLEIDRHQQMESRVAAYERWLDPAVRERIGIAVASRLALDLALLLREAGDMDGFAARLAEAAALDPSNRRAAAIAAGFFRLNVDDPYAEAELLIDLALADPTDITTQTAIASLLLEHGAYVGSARFYRIATSNFEAIRRAASGTLLADEAAAQWGAGRPEIALQIVRQRQQVLDELVQNQARVDEPSLDPVSRGRRRGLVNPTLAMVRAVILHRQGDPTAPAALVHTLEALRRAIANPATPIPPTFEAQVHLQMAWVAVWLGTDLDVVRGHLDAANTLVPLSDVARRRFDGWIALKSGDLATAVAQFEGIDKPDPPSLLGLAEAYHAQGRARESARVLLQIARDDPGSLVGITASTTLLERLGRRVPISDTARRLETLVASVPSSFDRYPTAPSLAVVFKVEPRQAVYDPQMPLMFDLVIANHASTPLAIDRNGPIRPSVILSLATDLERLLPPVPVGDGTYRRATMPRVVVEIDHRLRLQPRERLVVPLNLQEHLLGELIDSDPRRGAFLRVKGNLNAMRTQMGAIEPGLLGAEDWTDTLRLEGARIDPQWMVEHLEELSSIGRSPTDEELVTLSLVMDVVARRLREDAPPEFFQYISQARDRIGEIFTGLDPAAQAWLLATVPSSRMLDRFQTLMQQVRTSDQRLVKLVYLLRYVRSDADPVLVQARTSDDPTLRQLAESIVAVQAAAPPREDSGS